MNDHETLPLDASALNRVALIGPMTDEPYEQLGTWIFDGDAALSETPLQAMKEALPEGVELDYVRGMASTRSNDTSGFEDAVNAAREADVAILCLGEESILSGEAHSRADINLPGAQAELVAAIKATGTPVVLVILAGRPLTLPNVLDYTDALLFAWHPGRMAGPAICDLLFGKTSPVGRLPVSFPKMVGQVPIYYNQKNTGRPPSPEEIIHIDDIPVGAKQTSLGMTAFHLDAGYEPLFPFGFGLTYTYFHYDHLHLSQGVIKTGQTIDATINLTNTGHREGTEIVQLYIRDKAGSLTRPVRELKQFKRVTLQPGETQSVTFCLTDHDLSFYRRDGTFGSEPGEFEVWVGGNAQTHHTANFWLEA